MSETPNRAAAELLPQELLSAGVRQAVLDSPLPSLILSHSGRNVLFASHGFARRLGLPDGASLKRQGLPRLTPGTARLEALAQSMPDARQLERLRFGQGRQPIILNTMVDPLALSDGTPALLVSLIEAHPLMAPEVSAPLGPQPAPLPVQSHELPSQELHPLAPAPLGQSPLGQSPWPPAAQSSAPTSPFPASAAPCAPRPHRFVFTLAADGRIEQLSPAFGAALGFDDSALIGHALADVITPLDRNAGEAIRKAVAAGTTWGGIRLLWPHAALGQSVPVVLSAMPIHGDAGLTGFSGFGRVLFDEGSAYPPVAGVQDTQAQPAPRPHQAPTLDFADPAPSEAELGDLTRAMIAFSEAEDAVAAPTPSPQSPAPDSLTIEDVAPESAGVEKVPLVEGRESDNVVSLRPGQLDLPNGLPPHLSRPGLSMNERNAFREIARALGAKFDPDGGEATLPPGDVPTRPEPDATLPPDAPSADVPEVSAPEVLAPEVLAPEVLAPEVLAPEVLPPEVLAPEVSALAPHDAVEPEAEHGVPGAGMVNTLLVDDLPIGVLILRRDETVFINRTLLDLTGYGDLETLNAQGGTQALFRKGAMPRPREEGFETLILSTRTGETLPVDAHVQEILWQGEESSLIALRRAVELEQGKALTSVAQDLKRSRSEASELRAVLDTATDGVITLNGKGAILSLNGAAEALFGLNQNEVAGSSFTQLLHNESHAEALDYFEGIKANGVKSVLNDGREVWGREKKGGRIPLFLTLGRISDEEPRRFCAVLRDLTAWKRAEGDLQEARRAAESASAKKSDFLAKVGHEIRTPMNAIIGFAEVMEEERLGPVGNPKYKEYLGDIRTSGLHVVSLVNDLLDLSKIEAGRMELSFAATDLNAIVSGCVAIIQPQATQMRVLVRTQLAAHLPPVVADERSIRQIVLNLLSNATRFTASTGQVLVATALQESGEAVIRIRDTGVGMSASEIEQALESFRQVGPRRDNGGTGLGLPLSKALTEANRANFSIRSVPGEGTTVEIIFPPTRVLAE